MPPADHRLTLLTRADCRLCTEAKAVISRVAAGAGTPWNEVDVDGDPELRAEYGDRVPVVLLDGGEFGDLRVDEERLRVALAG